MNRFVLQALIIIGAGLITGFVFAWTSPVQLHLGDPNAGVPVRPIAHPPKGPTGATGSTAATGATGQVAPTAVPPGPGPTGPGPTGTGAAPAAENELYISVEAAKAIFDSQQAVFIDARPLDEFLKSHVPNAMHLEKDALNGPPPAKVLGYLPGMTVVLYCHGELCTDSANVIKRLLALNKGIGPYRIIKDGFPGWEKAGHPTASGPEVGFE